MSVKCNTGVDSLLHCFKVIKKIIKGITMNLLYSISEELHRNFFASAALKLFILENLPRIPFCTTSSFRLTFHGPSFTISEDVVLQSNENERRNRR
jgi:hypothetical protein